MMDFLTFLTINGRLFYSEHLVISTISFQSTTLYLTGTYNVWKVDQDLNILINYNPGGTSPLYRGIS